ncbi:hypothetical protein [Runella sp.]
MLSRNSLPGCISNIILPVAEKALIDAKVSKKDLNAIKQAGSPMSTMAF